MNMTRISFRIFFILFMVWLPHCSYSANVEWNRAFVEYEGCDSTGTYERYTMGSPYLRMKAQREGAALRIWAEPEVNLVSANTFIMLTCVPETLTVSPDSIYETPEYFAYAKYEGSLEIHVERAAYSILIDRDESICLAYSIQSADLARPITCGWVELGLDDGGALVAIRSAWDKDGDSILIGAIPEPSSGSLLLVGGAMLALRRRGRSP